MRAFAGEFIAEYNSSGLSRLEDVSRITFRRLGAFLHLALFMAWSHVISDNQKPPINFPANCLVGKYALPVVYYVASKASSIAADKRPFFQVCGCADYRWMRCKKYASADVSRGEEETDGVGLLLTRVF